jgi:uncharacterized membrane protein YheB (UPF0754 family)
MNLLNFLLNGAGGAATGYITNTIAIKMLFKKYGPLGGVILKTRGEFIENTSQLIEDEIINHHTLEEQVSGDEFEKVIEQIISELLDEQFFKSIGQDKWLDIPEID